ncbi:hypothetical protein [Streptodolium elevatio]|uniref:Uncharacterized protein n=1 Tax=Streptodolium elevatio TaxID=3157996 RepID=A0ABV3DF79_9ACTN
MGMERGTIDDVPLAALFPGAPTHDLDHVRRVAAAVDTLRLAAEPPEWEWFRDHAACPDPLPEGITPLVLTTTVALVHEETGVDWLELELDVAWIRPGGLAALAAVSVACWCDIDHNTHYPVETVVDVRNGLPLGEAFEHAASRLPAWLACPRDPEYWRAQAALPARPKLLPRLRPE